MNDVFIGGQWLPGSRGEFAVENPASREVITRVSDADAADAVAAVDAAAGALDGWRRTSPRDRSVLLHRAYELMISDRDKIAALISSENGKSLADATGEVTYAAEFFRWFAEEAVRTGGDYGVSPFGGTRTVVTHKPVGVAALVTPWNFPAAMAARKIAPALAAGCTVVLKPASETPLTAFAIARLLVEAGLPAGVINVVPTSDASSIVTAWMEDARVRKISFTGSTGIGRILLKQAADRVINSSMELGGNAPLIVTDDADIEGAVSGTMIAKFRDGGQACTAANRLYVHADVVEDFTARLGAEVESLTVGPADRGSQIGPLISPGQQVRVRARGVRLRGRPAAGPACRRSDRRGHGRYQSRPRVGPVRPVWRDEAVGPGARGRMCGARGVHRDAVSLDRLACLRSSADHSPAPGHAEIITPRSSRR